MSRSNAKRIFFGMLALWSVAQVPYLAGTLAMSPPSPTAELISTHAEQMSIVMLVICSIAAILFGFGAIRGPKGTWFKPYIFAVVVIIGVYLVILLAPIETKYDTFLDLPSERIIKREIHLLPPGITYQIIPFDDIEVITGEFVEVDRDPSPGYDICYQYVITVITQDGSRFEISRGPEQSTNIEPHPDVISLAESIAEISGADLNLR